MSVDINQLSEAELKAALKAKQQQSQNDRDAYKSLVNETVPEVMGKLIVASAQLQAVKTEVFQAFEDLVKMKFDIYEVREGQQTHTFSDKNGASIKIGYNVIDGWDDTVNSGIAKISEFIAQLAASSKDADTITILNHLLKRDDKGNLKSSRVLELSSLATEINNPLLTDGVKIIKDAHCPQFTSLKIEAWYKDDAGNKVNVPLNIASVPFPEYFDHQFLFPKAVKDE